jgi:hypothetical protein
MRSWESRPRDETTYPAKWITSILPTILDLFSYVYRKGNAHGRRPRYMRGKR